MKELRIAKGLTQTDLAVAAGVSYTTISRMERGLPISAKKAFAVCKALGVDDIKQIEGLKLATSRV